MIHHSLIGVIPYMRSMSLYLGSEEMAYEFIMTSTSFPFDVMTLFPSAATSHLNRITQTSEQAVTTWS